MDEWFKDWFDADYAALYGHRDDEEAERAVRTALGAAPGLAQGPVLDLACGMGRHLTPLRRRNPLAFGLDLSAHLLGEAAAELRPWLLRGDMRHLPLKPASLSGITLWFTPFGYFSDATNRTLLVRLTELLRPSGILLLDFLNASHMARTLVTEDVLERGGVRAHSRRAIEGDRIVKRITLTRLASGTSREVVESVRLYTPEELRGMASGAGLECCAELGTYGGTSFRLNDSPRWIGIFRKNFNP
jgi:SAM-dependent methyltransferase